jgi:hypothetical protein
MSVNYWINIILIIRQKACKGLPPAAEFVI